MSEALLRAFVQAVEDGGGVYLDDDDGGNDVAAFLASDAGLWRLGAVYMNVCDELGHLPVALVPCEGSEWDGQDALDTWERAKDEGRVRS